MGEGEQGGDGGRASLRASPSPPDCIVGQADPTRMRCERAAASVPQRTAKSLDRWKVEIQRTMLQKKNEIVSGWAATYQVGVVERRRTASFLAHVSI